MRRRKHCLASPEGDSGAALLMVLIMVSVISLGGAALLSLSDVSLRTTVALRDQAGDVYNADGAARVGIDSLRTGQGFPPGALFNNTGGTTCFGPNTTSGTLSLPDFYPATNGLDGTGPGSATIDCSVDPETGVNGTVVPINNANRPARAILALPLPAVPGEDGINIQALSGNPLAVKGIVRSNSNINVVSGTLQSTAAVTAFGPCSGTILSTPSASCNTNTNATFGDPNYPSEATFATPANAVPAYRPVPADVSASCPSGVVTFLPGYYDDAEALTTLMDSTGACAGSTWWFSPGTPADGGRYYFDFHNNTNDSDVYRGSVTASGGSADQWGITSGHLVAGTPADSNGNPIASPGASPTIPGSCQNPIRSATASGVQFIFGGDSQLALGGAADAEICGTYSATRPPIGVFGVRAGTATTRTLTGPGMTATAGLKMTPPATSPGNFTNPTNVIQQDGISATWVKATAPSETSTIAVSGYAPPSAVPPIPAGSIVKSATVRVRHGNLASYVAADRLAVTFTPKGVTGSPPGPAITPTGLTYPNSGALVTDPLVVQAVGGTSAFAQYVHDNGFTGADMTYAATLTHLGTENLDSIQIDISYVTPAFRRQNIATITSNCMTQPYTGASGAGCAVLSTSALPGFSGAFYVQGTTYTPFAAIDLTLNNATQQVLRLGVISRSLWVKENASFSYTGPVIELPNITVGGGGDPIVFLTVYVCPATTTSSCSTDPVDPAHPERGPIRALQVKARIEDLTPPSSTTRQMTILSWSNLR